MLHHRSRTLHEQAPKVAVAAFTDAEQGGLAARAVLAWDQPDRRGELPRIAEFDRQSAGRIDCLRKHLKRLNLGILGVCN
jgi:hypothetical protein